MGKQYLWVVLLSILLSLIPGIKADVDLQITAFSCSPDEVALGNQFSCTATISNAGTNASTSGTAILYDNGNWLSPSNPSTPFDSIGSGASTNVYFSGLKGIKSGNNGFSYIKLGDVTDTYVSGTNVNVIDVAVTESSSSSSAASGANVDVAGQATAGGNVDITMTFSVTSGDCSIGSQSASVSQNDMTDGQTLSKTWIVTMGTDNCAYSISAKATSNPDGTATKTVSDSGTISCSNCVSEQPGGGTTSGGGEGITAKKQCEDGLDNDGDGLIDLKDPGCESALDNDETDPKICTQSWSCTEWEECKEGRQTRKCSDANDCLNKKTNFLVDKVVEVSKPSEEQSCGLISEEPKKEGTKEEKKGILTQEEKIKEEKKKVILFALLIIGLIILALIVYLSKEKIKEKKKK